MEYVLCARVVLNRICNFAISEKPGVPTVNYLITASIKMGCTAVIDRAVIARARVDSVVMK